jgi:periplasmic protein TonB
VSAVALNTAGFGPHGIGPDRSAPARWCSAFVLVLGIHAAGLAVLLATRVITVEPSESLPAVMVDLAPPPSAPSVAEAVSPPSEAVPEMTLPDPVIDAALDTPVPVTTPPELQAVEMAEPPPPEPTPTPPEEAIKPTPKEQVAAAVALPPPPPKAAPKPKPKEKVVDRRPPKPVQAKRGERQDERRPPSEAAGAPTQSSASASSGSSAASRSSWQSAIVAALNRAKRPQSETGLASVRFSVDRSGRVLSASLAGSTGAAVLDGEAVSLVRRASLPSAPADVNGSTFTFTVPIRFTSR